MICYFLDVDCAEVGMMLELVTSNRSLVVTSPFYPLIQIVANFPIYVSVYVSNFQIMGS